jgi:hypothetical protein
MAMMAMTTSSSINVNPFFTSKESKLSGLKCKNYLTGSSKNCLDRCPIENPRRELAWKFLSKFQIRTLTRNSSSCARLQMQYNHAR